MRPNINESSKFKHKLIKNSRNNILSSSKPWNSSTSKRKSSLKCHNYPKPDCLSTTSGKLIHTARVNLSQLSPSKFHPSSNTSTTKQIKYLSEASHERIFSLHDNFLLNQISIFYIFLQKLPNPSLLYPYYNIYRPHTKPPEQKTYRCANQLSKNRKTLKGCAKQAWQALWSRNLKSQYQGPLRTEIGHLLDPP